MDKLLEQIVKFGAVGLISFLVDYLIGIIVLNLVLHTAGEAYYEIGSVVGSVLGFTISVIVNYLLSMKYVFARKENMNRKTEFTIFLVLSLIGLGINSLIIWVCVGPIYGSVALLRQYLGYSMMYTAAKVLATAVVMVYNFVTRKIFLEKKD